MRNTLSWLCAILALSTYHVQADTKFWLNEIRTVTSESSEELTQGDIELVVSQPGGGTVSVTVKPWHPNGSTTITQSLVQQSANSDWKGRYVTSMKLTSGYFPPNGMPHSGVLVTHGQSSRMYCWGNGVSTNSVVDGNTCESIITSDSRGLNAGKGTSIAYGLYNTEETPEEGGSEESHFVWRESKFTDDVSFSSLWKVNACSGDKCPTDLLTQVFKDDGQGNRPTQFPPPSGSSTKFWMNEIVTQTPSDGRPIRCVVEVVAETDEEGEKWVYVLPYHPTERASHGATVERTTEDGPWKGLYATSIDIGSGYYPEDGESSGMLVTHDGASRMYCWGEGVTTDTKVGDRQCESIITTSSRGLNGGAGTSSAYALYNKDDIPNGGDKESDFQWLESKFVNGTRFATLDEPNECPSKTASDSKCEDGIIDQVINRGGDGDGSGGGDGDTDGDGDGDGEAEASTGWRPTLSGIASAFLFAVFC